MEHQVAALPTTARAVDVERFRGNHGTLINPHRSIATLRLTAADIVLAIVMGFGLSGAVLWSMPWFGRGWTWGFDRLAAPLGFAAGVGVRAVDLPAGFHFQLPFFNAPALAPTPTLLWVTLVVTVVAVVVSFFLRDAFLPLAYAVRLAAVVQTTALIYFGLAHASLPYDLPGYITGMELTGVALLVLSPIVLGLTFYIIDVTFLQKLMLTAAVVVHLAVFIPLQYVSQSYLLAHGSLLFLPVLFMFFGLLPEIMIFIALFGWGMSWPAREQRGRRE